MPATNSVETIQSIPITLKGQLYRHWATLLQGAIYLLLFNGLRAAIDWMLKYGVDEYTSNHFSSTFRVGVALILAAICAVIVRIRSRVVLFNGGRNAEYELRQALLIKLHTLGLSFYQKVPVGDIMSRATNDLGQVRLLLGFGALNLVNTVFALISALAVMLSVSTKLTLVSLLLYPLLALLTRSFSKSLFTRNRQNQEALGALSDRVQANLAGVRVVRSFALEDFEARTFDTVNRDYLDKNMALVRVRGIMGPMMGTLATLGTCLVFWYGGRLVATGQLSKGDFVAFLSALGRLVWPTMALGFMLAIVQRGRASFSRLKEIFNTEPEVKDEGTHAMPLIQGDLEVRRLSFAYPSKDRAILKEVSFHVAAGRSLAIVGRTGSGKTTLATLLPRLLSTPKGTIFLDGVDVCEMPLETLRSSIGYAPQDAFLFSISVRNNVAFALPENANMFSENTQNQLIQALQDAHIWNETQHMPDGIETIVGERGVQLSGGQRQRVALARALLRKPKVLILDDPLSAVDTKTEAAILEAIEKQQQARTVLLITHRVSAASRCDQIIVLDEGKVIEQGTHEQLVQAKGLYARFAEEQAIASELESI